MKVSGWRTGQDRTKQDRIGEMRMGPVGKRHLNQTMDGVNNISLNARSFSSLLFYLPTLLHPTPQRCIQYVLPLYRQIAESTEHDLRAKTSPVGMK